MAIRRLPLASLCKSVNFGSSIAIVSLIFSENSSLISLYRPLCTEVIDSLPPVDDIHISNNLISLLVQRKFSPNDPELKNLAPKLNTRIVENVLNGLRSWKTAHAFFIWASKQSGYEHNCYTYNAIASILSHARQNAPLKSLAMDILNSRCSMTPGALGFFLRCLGSVGLIEEANFLFDQVRTMNLCVPNNYSYNCLLEILSRTNCVDSIENRLREMKYFGWEVDKYTSTPILKAYCNSGKFEKALEIYNDMYERGWVDEHVISIMALSFTKWGEVDKAVEFIDSMGDQNSGLNEKTFYALIHGFMKNSREDMALKFLEKMQKFGFSPDISVYDVIIGGLCRKREFKKAMDLYWEMKAFGIVPDIKILTKLIAVSSEERDMTMLLEDRPKDVNSESMMSLYNSVLTGLVNLGSIDKAHCLLQVMIGNECRADVHIDEILQIFKGVFPNTTSFSIVIDGLLKTGDLDAALRLFEDMGRISGGRNQLLYNNMIDELCKSDRLEESCKLMKEMKESGFQPTHFTHNSIFGCLCRRGNTVGAIELLREMRGHGHEPWIKHSTFLVKLLCRNGRVMEACNFLDDMVCEGFLPDIISYSATMDGLVKILEVDRAFEMFQDICTRGYRPDVVAYNILINGFCKAGRVHEAQDLVKKMTMAGLVPTIVTYNLLIDGWCKNGDVDQAIACLSRMNGEDREPNVITYTTLIDGCCNSGRPDDAEILWNEMERKGCSPNRIAYMAIVQGLCKCGRPNAALVHYQKMEEREMKSDIYVSVALINAFIFNQNLPMALEILKKSVEKGHIPDPTDKNYVLLRDAVFKLSEDSTTCSSVKSLIENGCIPTIGVSDLGS